MAIEGRVDEKVVEKTAEQKGGFTTNKVLQNELSRILSKDASVDLQPWLDKSASSYSTNRSKAVDYALRQSRTELAPLEPKPRPSLPRFISRAVSSKSPLMVLHDLQSAVQTWAVEKGLLHFPEAIIEDQLVEAILDYQIIADLPSSTLIGLSPDLVIKSAPLSAIRYLPTFDYIAREVSQLQVAAHLGVLGAESRAYIFMRRVPGISLDKIWADLGQSQKTSVMQQLEVSFGLLRMIPRPSSDFPLGTGSPAACVDVRRYNRTSSSIIRNEHDFNQFLITKPDGSKMAFMDMTLGFMQENHEIVLTHGDLHPRNIMVTQNTQSGEIKVEALIDWEMCGWYPAYWEYIKALNTISHADGTLDWYKYLPIKAIGMWGNEYAVDQLIDRRL